MIDIYSAMIGEPPTDREKIAALAEKLRGRNMLGSLGQITGDKVLAPLGKGISAETEDQAEKIANRGIVSQQLDRADNLAKMKDEYELGRLGKEQDFNRGEHALDRALQRELEAMQQAGLNARDKDNVDKEALKEKKQLDAYRVRFSTQLEKAGLPELESYIGTANKVLDQYKGKGIPGIGILDFSGRTTQEGSNVKQAIQAVKNTLLKARSGAAVTEPEADRLEQEMFGPLATEESFRRGWASLQAAIANRRLNIEAGYDPLVVESYDEIRRNRSRGASGSFGTPEKPIESKAGVRPEDYDTYEQYLEAVKKAGG
jgi:hypothetical protein